MCLRVRVSDTVAIVCLGGPIRKIVANGRVWHFEMHRYLGPMPVHKKTGTGINGTKQFWTAVSQWAQQGEQIDGAGVCIYDSRIPIK